MVCNYTNNVNDKISLIIDTDQLFDQGNLAVQSMIDGDTYLIDELYKESLEIIKDNQNIAFNHMMTNESMSLNNWMIYYKCNINDPKSIVVFLRLAVLLLKF